MKNIFLVIMSLIIISCTKSDDSMGLIFNIESYDANRELWESSGIKDYSFIQEYHSTSVGGLPKLITVVIDNKLDTIYTQSIEFQDYSIDDNPHFKTINDIFDYINYIVESCNEQINSSDSPMEGAKIDVEYDEKYFYPTQIKCVGYYPEGLVGGLSVVINISDFNVN